MASIIVSIVVAAVIAVGINDIIGKLGGDQLSLKPRTIISIAVDAVFGVLVSLAFSTNASIGAKIYSAVIVAIGSIVVADLGYDTVIKLIKAVISRLKSIKTEATK